MAAKTPQPPRNQTGRRPLAGTPGPLGATSILPESPEVRLMDAAVTGGVAVGSVLWTATRATTGQQYGWGAFWTALGTGMAIMGRGELRYGGFGLIGANLGYLALRTVTPVLDKPGGAAALVTPAGPVRLGYTVLHG